MKQDVEEQLGVEPPPKTLFVLGLLGLTALIFSYLGSYAMVNALIAGEVIKPIQPGNDQRPKWLIEGFCILMLTFMAIAEIFRRLSKRQMTDIDAMADERDVIG